MRRDTRVTSSTLLGAESDMITGTGVTPMLSAKTRNSSMLATRRNRGRVSAGRGQGVERSNPQTFANQHIQRLRHPRQGVRHLGQRLVTVLNPLLKRNKGLGQLVYPAPEHGHGQRSHSPCPFSTKYKKSLEYHIKHSCLGKAKVPTVLNPEDAPAVEHPQGQHGGQGG